MAHKHISINPIVHVYVLSPWYAKHLFIHSKCLPYIQIALFNRLFDCRSFRANMKKDNYIYLNCSLFKCVNIMSSTHHTLYTLVSEAQPSKNLYLIELDEWRDKKNSIKSKKKSSEKSKELNEKRRTKCVWRFVFVDLMMWMFARWCVLHKYVTKFPVFGFDLYWMVEPFCWLAKQWFCHWKTGKFDEFFQWFQCDEAYDVIAGCLVFICYLNMNIGCWILLEQRTW